MSPREALARITAICDGFQADGHGDAVSITAIRAALAEVTPERGVTLTPEEAALARGVIEETFVAEYELDRLRALHELAVRLGGDLPPFEEEEDDE